MAGVRLDQPPDHVVAGLLARLLDQVAEVGEHLLEAAQRALVPLDPRLAAGAERDERELVGPAAEAVAVLARRADQVGDDHGGQRVGEVEDQLVPPVRDERVEQVGDLGLDAVSSAAIFSVRNARGRGGAAACARAGR